MSRNPLRPTRSLTLALIAGALALSACSDIPDLRSRETWRQGPRAFFDRPAVTAPAPAPVAPMGPAPAASDAESACLQAGRDAGFDVRGVVGTHEVADASGAPASRDVMLRVQRGSQSLEVRCSFSYAEGSAQIMTL